jgi:hypothetical protein
MPTTNEIKEFLRKSRMVLCSFESAYDKDTLLKQFTILKGTHIPPVSFWRTSFFIIMPVGEFMEHSDMYGRYGIKAERNGKSYIDTVPIQTWNVTIRSTNFLVFGVLGPDVIHNPTLPLIEAMILEATTGDGRAQFVKHLQDNIIFAFHDAQNTHVPRTSLSPTTNTDEENLRVQENRPWAPVEYAAYIARHPPLQWDMDDPEVQYQDIGPNVRYVNEWRVMVAP